MLLKRDCLFVAVVFCILLVMNNEEGEVWNVKAMNLRAGSGMVLFRVSQNILLLEKSSKFNHMAHLQFFKFFPIIAVVIIGYDIDQLSSF